jgi:hypothetical protein
MAITTESTYEFRLFHGNLKHERIKLSPTRFDGYFYNGNFVIMYPESLDKVSTDNLSI